jgi:hypothetical protein
VSGVCTMLSLAVSVSYIYGNCGGERNYVLRSHTVRGIYLKVIVGSAVHTDVEGIPRARRRSSGNDLDLNSWGRGPLVRTFEVLWLSYLSFSRRQVAK